MVSENKLPSLFPLSKGGQEARPSLHWSKSHFLWQVVPTSTIKRLVSHPSVLPAVMPLSDNQPLRLVTMIQFDNMWKGLDVPSAWYGWQSSLSWCLKLHIFLVFPGTCLSLSKV